MNGLVISRRVGEETIIRHPAGYEIVVRVTSIKGDKVRLGIEAPRDIQVHRREVAEHIAIEAGDNREAHYNPDNRGYRK